MSRLWFVQRNGNRINWGGFTLNKSKETRRIFSRRLKGLRVAKGASQNAVAETVGIAAVVYQRYEYGENEPRFEVLCKLADYFGVSTDYLLGRTDEPQGTKPPHEVNREL